MQQRKFKQLSQNGIKWYGGIKKRGVDVLLSYKSVNGKRGSEDPEEVARIVYRGRGYPIGTP